MKWKRWLISAGITLIIVVLLAVFRDSTLTFGEQILPLLGIFALLLLPVRVVVALIYWKTEKKPCGVCEKSLEKEKKHKISGGHICHDCFLAAGYTPGMVCFADSAGTIKWRAEQRVHGESARTAEELQLDLQLQAKATRDAELQAKIRANNDVGLNRADNTPRCSRCGSTSISADKKGFGVGKAVVGAALVGPLTGLVAGSSGSKKVRITCLNCGHHWMAGKG